MTSQSVMGRPMLQIDNTEEPDTHANTYEPQGTLGHLCAVLHACHKCALSYKYVMHTLDSKPSMPCIPSGSVSNGIPPAHARHATCCDQQRESQNSVDSTSALMASHPRTSET